MWPESKGNCVLVRSALCVGAAMIRRGFLAGLLAAPVVLKFAGALSPKPIEHLPILEAAVPQTIAVNGMPAMFAEGDLVILGGFEEVMRVTKVSFLNGSQQLQVDRGKQSNFLD